MTEPSTKIIIPTFMYQSPDENDCSNLCDDQSVIFHNVKTANLLVVGPSGTGKTTFINTMKKPTYTSLAEIDSQTREADMTSNLFEKGGEFFMMQTIDTPGFGDSSKDGKTDFELEEMILKFVKRGITHLHLVLVAIRFGIRYDKPQLDSLMNVLRFLGKDMRTNTALLFTYAEKTTPEDRSRWINMMEKSEARNILRFCHGKVFFTGMCTEKNEIDRVNFVKNLRNDHLKIIHAATTYTPIALHGDDHDAVCTQFKVYESAAKDSLTMRKLLPELPDLAKLLLKYKEQLAKYPDDDHVEELFEKWKVIDTEEINKNVVEWSKFQAAIAQYVEHGSVLQKNAAAVREQYTVLVKAIHEFKTRLDDIELFS